MFAELCFSDRVYAFACRACLQTKSKKSQEKTKRKATVNSLTMCRSHSRHSFTQSSVRKQCCLFVQVDFEKVSLEMQSSRMIYGQSEYRVLNSSPVSKSFRIESMNEREPSRVVSQSGVNGHERAIERLMENVKDRFVYRWAKHNKANLNGFSCRASWLHLIKL